MLNEISIETFNGDASKYATFERKIREAKNALVLATLVAGEGVARDTADKALAELAMIIFVD